MTHIRHCNVFMTSPQFRHQQLRQFLASLPLVFTGWRCPHRHLDEVQNPLAMLPSETTTVSFLWTCSTSVGDSKVFLPLGLPPSLRLYVSFSPAGALNDATTQRHNDATTSCFSASKTFGTLLATQPNNKNIWRKQWDNATYNNNKFF